MALHPCCRLENHFSLTVTELKIQAGGRRIPGVRCQAAIEEFNALAAVQAWRAQPAEAAEAGTSGTTDGAADEGGSGMQVEA